MSTDDVDRYLHGLDQPKRSTLEEMRRRILEIVPDAEQVISYGVPAFKVRGKTIAGLAAFKNHLSYLPHSGSVLGLVSDDTGDYTQTRSALHFAIDTPLPRDLLDKLIEIRRQQAGV